MSRTNHNKDRERKQSRHPRQNKLRIRLEAALPLRVLALPMANPLQWWERMPWKRVG